MVIDSHCHLNFPDFDNNREKIIRENIKNNILAVNVGVNFLTSKKAVEIAKKFALNYASVGLHPMNIGDENRVCRYEECREKEFDFSKYADLADSKKVIAVGEIGLDYWRKPKGKKKREIFKEKQKNILVSQLGFASYFNLPVIFHCRMAHKDLIDIISKYSKERKKIRGVIHSFVGSPEELKKYLSLGLYVGFNGIIFKKIEGIDFEKLIALTPEKSILTETDSPFLCPPKGDCPGGANQPKNAAIILRKIAESKKLREEKMEGIIKENFYSLFGLTKQ